MNCTLVNNLTKFKEWLNQRNNVIKIISYIRGRGKSSEQVMQAVPTQRKSEKLKSCSHLLIFHLLKTCGRLCQITSSQNDVDLMKVNNITLLPVRSAVLTARWLLCLQRKYFKIIFLCTNSWVGNNFRNLSIYLGFCTYALISWPWFLQ